MKPAPKDKSHSISELAAEFDISPRTIRFYEEKGLLSPKRTSGNQRTYTKKNRARLRLILRGKRFGYSLEEIAEMIGMTTADKGEIEQIEASLAYGDKKLQEIRERTEELQIMKRDLLSVREKLLKRLDELRRQETR
jgi:DNA-binding transcriptional MerR regulator